jgi:hypothetical protein
MNRGRKMPQMMGIDTIKACSNIERSYDTNSIQKWLDLLDTIMHMSKYHSNIERQISYLKIIANFCRDKEGVGVYPYQM